MVLINITQVYRTVRVLSRPFIIWGGGGGGGGLKGLFGGEASPSRLIPDFLYYKI